ncbi:MAG: phosphoenolpyruvate--protein phosphotransferase, partial [Gammaproteobacteria bacterium]|nr:phosphoenolpyruvate--protein phosphotransferase [Gammaproteobacteria bacterium]
MTFAIHGVGVSNGIAIGRVHLIRRDQLDIREYQVALPDIDNEVRRFNNAVTIARQQLRAVRDHIPNDTAEDISAFIDTHLLMLEDSALIQEPTNIIEQNRCNAEWALQLQRDSLVNVFEAMDDAYLRTRKDDVDHVVARIQRVLLNQSPLRHEQPDSRLRGYIVLADELSPADTVLMDHHGITAFATDTGGPTSHTAILARSLGIPGIVGLHAATRYIAEDEEVIIDGKQGVVIVDPDERTLDYYRGRQQARIDYLRELRKLRGTAAVSVDGQPVGLMANVELPADISAVTEVGADGIGLYRTEYLYMNRSEFPDEEEQFERYRGIVEILEGRPLTIRTLDVGADKEVDSRHTNANEEANPALGLRGLRLCLKEPDIFKPQLRAILRASAFGPVR